MLLLIKTSSSLVGQRDCKVPHGRGWSSIGLDGRDFERFPKKGGQTYQDLVSDLVDAEAGFLPLPRFWSAPTAKADIAAFAAEVG